MEVWTLDHPEHGRLELRQGFDAEFLAEDPDWPLPKDAAKENAPEATGQDEVSGPSSGSVERTGHGERAPLDASFPARVRARLKNPPLRLQVRIDGEVTGRYPRTGVDVIRLTNPRKDDDGWSTFGSDAGSSRRMLKIQSTMLGDLLSVQLRESSSVVEFDPPPGSRGAKRQAAMESSSVKRILYPLMGGMGKAGAAIVVLVVLPLLARLLAPLLPDWEVDLPEFTLPQIHLPVPVLPQIRLPVPRLPAWEVDLPPLPGWLVTVLEYDQVWKPIVVGVVIGVIAVRNHRRSERQKAEWAAAHEEPTGEDGAEQQQMQTPMASAADASMRP